MDKRHIAHHEAAHAVAAIVHGFAITHSVTKRRRAA